MGDFPALGDWLVPRTDIYDDGRAPGMVVQVICDGNAVILASRPAPHYEVIELAYKTRDLKGPMTGQKPVPVPGMFEWRKS